MLVDYYRTLARIHRYLRPRTYLEIGVHHGESLALALPSTLAVGVDPDPDVRVPLPSGARVVRSASDDFFAAWPVLAPFDGLPVELAFVDGLHHFEQALRDVLNVERHSAPGTVILVHDCLPLDAITSSRERTTLVWSGDVWKVVACLRRYRPDLAIATVDVPPTGLAVITNLQPNASPAPFDEMCRAYLPLTYDDLIRSDRDAALNRVDGDWSTVAALLGARCLDG
jgi:Methyltransferase domain